jgi:hypothetical protein
MHNAIYKAIVASCIAVYCSSVVAQEWQTGKSKTYQGLDATSMWVSKHEFGLDFYCDESNGQDQRLSVKFLGPVLPRLYGEDGDTAKLSLLFTLRGGVLHREAWPAYYFDGGPGDQAWLGSIHAGTAELNALSRALKLEILNQDGESVYSFPTKGTSVGVTKIHRVCRLGVN